MFMIYASNAMVMLHPGGSTEAMNVHDTHFLSSQKNNKRKGERISMITPSLVS